ncbi:MAG: DUF4365 domain-containing protein [Planctomycetia bacterium]|nr:DUF4365 domain-containing protein [Planctomycetia bacterium]
MARRSHHPRKRRTREHIIADLSVNYVERFALKCGYAVERVWHDYGLDLMVFTYTKRGEAENGHFWVQLKATDRLRLRKDRQAVVLRVQRSHLLHWLKESFPIMLIVYDARLESAYWLYVQRDVGRGRVFGLNRTENTITLHVPVANTLDEVAMRQFGRFKANWDQKQKR